jgi:hypothetical protein
METVGIKKFALSFAELSVIANAIAHFVTRDLADFAKFSITSDDADELQDLQNSFEVISSDET